MNARKELGMTERRRGGGRGGGGSLGGTMTSSYSSGMGKLRLSGAKPAEEAKLGYTY